MSNTGKPAPKRTKRKGVYTLTNSEGVDYVLYGGDNYWEDGRGYWVAFVCKTREECTDSNSLGQTWKRKKDVVWFLSMTASEYGEWYSKNFN